MLGSSYKGIKLNNSLAQPLEGLASKTAILLLNRLLAKFATNRKRAEYSTFAALQIYAGNLRAGQNSNRAQSTN
jgi:hypothetical protein